MSALIIRSAPGAALARPSGPDRQLGVFADDALRGVLDRLVHEFLWDPAWPGMTVIERAAYIDHLADDLRDAVRGEFRASALHDNARFLASPWTNGETPR